MILVTGASGLLGSAVTQDLRLSELEYQVLDRSFFDPETVPHLNNFVRRTPTVIIHLAAAVPQLPRSIDNESLASVTRAIDVRVASAARDWGSRLVYLSGCSLYASADPNVKTEDSPLQSRPCSPYLRAKLEGDKVAQTLPSHAVLRISSPLSPRLPSRTVAAQFVRRAVDNKMLEVWGSGRREQDFVDVIDVAICIRQAALSGAIGVFNVTSNRATTMTELAHAVVRAATGGHVVFSNRPDPLDEQQARFCNEKSQRAFSWQPGISLEESLDRMVAQYRLEH